MQIDSVTLNKGVGLISVTYEDGATKDYTDAAAYLADHPERVNDVPAMGWEIPEGWEPPAPVAAEPPPEPNDA